VQSALLEVCNYFSKKCPAVCFFVQLEAAVKAMKDEEVEEK
jgi:hypothetical protein